MPSFAHMRGDRSGGAAGPVREFWVWPLSVIGLLATLYLCGLASFWLYLSFVFGVNAAGISPLERARHIVVDAAPLLAYAAIGFAGLRFVFSERRRSLGIAAIVGEAAMAGYAYTHPASLPLFTGWLR